MKNKQRSKIDNNNSKTKCELSKIKNKEITKQNKVLRGKTFDRLLLKLGLNLQLSVISS